jgi:type IV pilus assembly protein PilQ
MTRMLCSLICLVLFFGPLAGCTLFSSSDETTTSAEVLDESSLDQEFAAAEGLDDELQSLASDEVMSDAGFDELPADDGLDDFSADTSFVEDDFSDEFQAAELDQGFGKPDDMDLAFSETGDQSVDQSLATDELGFGDDFNDDTDDFMADTVVDDDPLMQASSSPDPSDLAVSSNQITNLAYKAFESGGTVVIDTTQPVEYNVINDNNLNQVIIQIDDVFLPQRFKRPYITKDFKQDIATINAYQEPGTNSARVVIQLKRPMEPVVEKEGNSILVMTSDAGTSVVANNTQEESLDDLVSNNQMEVSTQSGAPAMTDGSETVPDSLTQSKAADSLSLSSSQYTGEKISLEFFDTDVRAIIEVIAEKSGVNLIMDKDVEGTTSMRLRDVPWDQALVVLLRSQSLGYVKQGNVLRIAKQATLSQEAQAVSAQIKSEKEAQLYSSGIKVKYIPVSYAKVEDLAGKLKDFKSEEGKIASDERTSSLVITDYPEYIDRIRELVKALDTPPMQVEIAAKLIEAREEFTREAGINWDISGSAFNIGNGRSGTVNSAFAPGEVSNQFSLDLSVGTFDIFGDLSAALSIFEQQDKVKVLSQPRIVTMNKTKATISQTTQIPVETIMPMMGAGAIPIPMITFEDLTLSLDVTPQITFKGDVILEVELKREFPGQTAANGQVEINRRNAKTTIMVKNGKTAVIGGIYQLDDIDRDSGIPWLKDIPLVGYLFKRIELNKSKNELLLFLKPKILKEVESEPMLSKASSLPKADEVDNFDGLFIDEGSVDSLNDMPSSMDSFSDDISDDELFKQLEGEVL